MKGLQKIAEEQLEGGLADGVDPREFSEEQLAKGIEVELEHTDDESAAREIAMDHLAEDPEYYIKLEQIDEH